MSRNNKTTTSTVASIAAKVLQDGNASTIAKQLAGSALSQVNKVNQTGSQMENLASKVLKSEKYSEQTQKLAASILAQSNKKR